MAFWWPFVCLMTPILVYRLSKIMFASHRGIYMKILDGCYQNHESASLMLTIRWSKTIVGQVDLTAKLCLSFCLEIQSAKSTYQHVDLDLQ